jgi:NTE family protein
MRRLRTLVGQLGIGLLLVGCATRPVNPPLAKADPLIGYRYLTPERRAHPSEDFILLAFSGGGTRAAAFSYGVLEALREVEIVSPNGKKGRLLDSVSVITGVSGGSFTALSYGLYGDKLFEEYEQRFLKRDVEGTLLGRMLNPSYWGALSSTGWGRSELAADYYDEILFNGATYADLLKRPGPMIVANATDLSSGSRFYFSQTMFDIMCSDLSAVHLSRAAASSSAVPLVFSPVTFNNYGGSCGFHEPSWLKLITDPTHPVRPAARAMRELQELKSFGDSKDRPYVHLVDGGVADNLAMRGVLNIFDEIEALRLIGQPTPLDQVRRVVVVVVNSLSTPKTDWDKRESAPGPVDILLKVTGVPIDHYSYEAVELLGDTAARWQTMREMRDAAAPADRTKPAFREAMRIPNAEIFVVDVSFALVSDVAEREYLNQLPTSFSLPGEAVDRLRASAKEILLKSPGFNRYMLELGTKGYKVEAPSADSRAKGRPD